MSNNLGLVDFAIRLVNSVFNLPDGQVKFFGEFKLQKYCNKRWKFIKPRCNGGLRSSLTDKSALLLSDVIDFAMLPTQRFWRETVCYMSCDLEVINESARCGEKNLQLYTLYITRQLV